MTAAVSLNKFLFEMDALGFVSQVYINRLTGEFLQVTEDDLMYAQQDNDEDAPEDEREFLPKIREVLASDDWVELPSKDGIDEQSMEKFCNSVQDTKLRDALLAALRERGTYAKFRTMLKERNMDAQWQEFRKNATREAAVDWLKSNNISYDA